MSSHPGPVPPSPRPSSVTRSCKTHSTVAPVGTQGPKENRLRPGSYGRTFRLREALPRKEGERMGCGVSVRDTLRYLLSDTSRQMGSFPVLSPVAGTC